MIKWTEALERELFTPEEIEANNEQARIMLEQIEQSNTKRAPRD